VLIEGLIPAPFREYGDGEGTEGDGAAAGGDCRTLTRWFSLFNLLVTTCQPAIKAINKNNRPIEIFATFHPSPRHPFSGAA
jgi:hypothetical protein